MRTTPGPDEANQNITTTNVTVHKDEPLNCTCTITDQLCFVTVKSTIFKAYCKFHFSHNRYINTVIFLKLKCSIWTHWENTQNVKWSYGIVHFSRGYNYNEQFVRRKNSGTVKKWCCFFLFVFGKQWRV